MLNYPFKKKEILVVSGFMPFPPIFGGAIDVWERIKGLHTLGYEIDLVVTDKYNPTTEQIEQLNKFIRHFYFVKRENKVHQLLRKLPLQFLSRKGLKYLKINQQYHCVILESEFCWAVTLNDTITYKNLIVRVHNIESLYFKMLGKSATNLKEKIYYKLETAKIKQLSQIVFQKADRLWFISKDDLKVCNLPQKSMFMPFPVNDAFVQPTVKKGFNVVFMGSLFMQNNLYGLDWYVKNVHPLLIKEVPDYHFYIIGSLKEENLELDKKYSQLNKVTIVINAPCLKNYYEKAAVFINPMFHGSGVKVKSVNALVNGLPLVSTSIGVEGIGLTDTMYYHANNVTSFKEQIILALTNQENAVQKTQLAQDYLQKNNYLTILQKELNALD